MTAVLLMPNAEECKKVTVFGGIGPEIQRFLSAYSNK